MTVHRNRPTGADEAGQMEVNRLKKVDWSIVAIVLSILSILINLCFSGRDLLRNLRWILSCLGW